MKQVATKSPNYEIPVNKKYLYGVVEKLTNINPARNYKNIEALDEVADYIRMEFKKLDCKRKIQKFKINDNIYQNVIASFGNENAPRLIVGAHYDVCEDQPGADDNASAVAGLLELARLLNELKPDLDYRVDFVAYTLEEPPFFGTDAMGSAVHAKSLKDSNTNVIGMVCLEMIGYYSDEPNSQEYPIESMKNVYPTVANFIAVVGKTGQNEIVEHIKAYMKASSDIGIESINAPELVTGIDFSDHRNYWKQGYQACMINNTSFYRNPNYHQKTDTIDTLDFDKMTEVVRGLYWALVNFDRFKI